MKRVALHPSIYGLMAGAMAPPRTMKPQNWGKTTLNTFWGIHAAQTKFTVPPVTALRMGMDIAV